MLRLPRHFVVRVDSDEYLSSRLDHVWIEDQLDEVMITCQFVESRNDGSQRVSN